MPRDPLSNTIGDVYLTAPDGDRLLKLAEVSARVALGKSAIYTRISDGTFPAPVSLGPGTVRWRKSEVDDWIRCLQPTVSRGGEAPPDPRSA